MDEYKLSPDEVYDVKELDRMLIPFAETILNRFGIVAVSARIDKLSNELMYILANKDIEQWKVLRESCEIAFLTYLDEYDEDD